MKDILSKHGLKVTHLLQTYPKMSVKKAQEIAAMRLYHEEMNAIHTVLHNELQGYFSKNYNMSDSFFEISDEYLKEHYQ